MANIESTPNLTTLADGSTATTQAGSDNSTKVATTAYADAAGSSTPQHQLFSTVFEGTSRFTQTTNGGGSVSFGTNGVDLNTSATGTSSADAKSLIGFFQATDFTQPMTISVIAGISSHGSDYDAYVGGGDDLTVTGTSITYTNDHFGFKFERASSGTATTAGTNADGITETETALTTNANISSLFAVFTPATDIKYYVNQTLEATATTNLPDTANGYGFQASASNLTVASATTLRLASFNFSMDAF